MGAVHAGAYANMTGDVEVVGVYSRNLDRARAVASICRARPHANADNLLDEVDAVDICLPTALHRDFAVRALARGRHVMCETPLALDLDEARQMREAA